MKTKFKIVEIDNDYDFKMWDKWLSLLPFSSPFSTSWWLKAVCNVFGGEPKIFLIKKIKNDELVGGIALREVKLFKKSIISPSNLTLYMPLVLNFNKLDYRAIISIEKELGIFLRKKFNVIRWVSNTTELIDIRGFKWEGFDIDVNYTAITELRGFNISMLESAQKKQINKALRNGIILKKCDDIEIMWNIWSKTFKRQGIIVPVEFPKVKYLYKEIKKNKAGQGFVAFGKDNEPMSFRINIWNNKNIVYDWIAGTDSVYFKYGASSFAIWSILNYFKSKDFNYFDWCGINIESIANFKLSFGPALHPKFTINNIPLWFNILYNFRHKTKTIMNKIKL